MGCKQSKLIFPDSTRYPYGPLPYTTSMFDEHRWWFGGVYGLRRDGTKINHEDVKAGFEPIEISWFLEKLDELDEKLSDPNNLISTDTDVRWDVMELDNDAKFVELRAIQCQTLCYQVMKTSDKAKRANLERFIRNYEIAEVRARTASEIITLIMPDIYSHPVCAKALKEWKKFKEDYRLGCPL